MAVPKTTQTRHMDGSVQRTTQVTPSLHLFFFGKECVSKLCCEITGNIFVQKTKKKKRCRDGVTCVVLCTLPSICLVCVVFGTAIPTSFYILENVFHTLHVHIVLFQPPCLSLPPSLPPSPLTLGLGHTFSCHRSSSTTGPSSTCIRILSRGSSL